MSTDQAARMIGDNLLSETARQGHSKSWLAEQADLTPAELDEALTSGRVLVTDLWQMATALGVPVSSLMPN